MLADETAIRYTVLRYRAAVLVPQCFREKWTFCIYEITDKKRKVIRGNHELQ